MMELQYQRLDGITGIYYNTPYVIQACITTHTMDLQACITTYQTELQYYPIDGITGI